MFTNILEAQSMSATHLLEFRVQSFVTKDESFNVFTYKYAISKHEFKAIPGIQRKNECYYFHSHAKGPEVVLIYLIKVKDVRTQLYCPL